MTYASRGRSLAEVVCAVVLLGFITGFVAVLCIGNFFRAKRAMERQRQRRLADRMSSAGGLNTDMEDGGSSYSSSPGSRINMHGERQYLLGPSAGGDSGARRRNRDDAGEHDLLLFDEEDQPTRTMAV